MIRLCKVLVAASLVLVPLPVENATLDYYISTEEVTRYFYDKKFLISVDVTMYHPLEEQTDATPHIVADGTEFNILSASDLRWIAVSRDLHVRWGGPLQFGDIVYLAIPGSSSKSGYYLVKDTMNKRWSTRIDILESPGSPHYSYVDASLYAIKPIQISRDQLWFSHIVQ